MSAHAHVPNRIQLWFGGRPDERLLRLLFALMVIATIAVVGLDYARMLQTPQSPVGEPSLTAPDFAKPATEILPSRRGGERRPGILRTADKTLGAPIRFELAPDGRMMATGSIVPGSADAFASEIEKRGSYIKTVVLHSPGGSVQDALRIGRLIRERKYNTEVPDGSYCASSCPLIFAGGIERIAGQKAAIGVHQVSAVTKIPNATMADGMSNAQRVSAEIQRYLSDMGVDVQVWTHAMDTPANELFYFKPKELLDLRLATPRGA